MTSLEQLEARTQEQQALGRVVVAGGETLPLTLDAVRPGDYVGSSLPPFGGWVRSRILVAGRIPAFLCDGPNGEAMLIFEREARLAGYADCRPLKGG